MPELELRGCRTTPLLSYLKAIGVFRHVARADRDARLWWSRAGFAQLRSKFDHDGLVRFFMDEYEPSPITSPWNGGSGYFTGDNTKAIEKIECSAHPRFESLRAAIHSARRLLEGRAVKPETAEKPVLLEQWRASCPEPALAWLDAAVVLADDGPSMNPLLGTGGNDGRLEFSNNFMQRLIECLPQAFDDAGIESAVGRLRGALYGEPADLIGAAVGMFDPGTAGLPNSSSGPAEGFMVNPWDFVLMLEGALAFGGGMARRLSAEHATFPFTVTRTSRIGRSFDTGADAKTRGESWLPVWHRPASYASTERLFAEGRTQDGRHQARSGRETLRAVNDVGVDRGIASFERVVFAERFGRNHIAVPAGRVQVGDRRHLDLVRAADPWLDRVRRIDSNAIRRCIGELERAEADLASASNERAELERWLLALARTQQAVARRPASRATSQTTHVRPLGGLDAAIVLALEDSVEHRLARSLAAVGRDAGATSFRSLVEPVAPTANGRFAWAEARRALGDLRRPESLLAALAQTLIAPDNQGRTVLERLSHQMSVRLPDVTAFLERETDDERIVRLAYAFSLCLPAAQRTSRVTRRTGGVDRVYAACRLAIDPPPRPDDETARRRSPEVIPLLTAGNAALATRTAVRGLRASRLAPLRATHLLARSSHDARRIAAALAFPLHPDDRATLEQAVLVVEPHTDEQPSTEGAIA